MEATKETAYKRVKKMIKKITEKLTLCEVLKYMKLK